MLLRLTEEKGKVEHICPEVLSKVTPCFWTDISLLLYICGYSCNNKKQKIEASWLLLSTNCCSFCCMSDVHYKCDRLLLSSFMSQEAHVTDADTNNSPGHPNAKAPTPVPRTKVHAWFYSSITACWHLCFPTWDCMLRNALSLFMLDNPRSNLHESFKFPYIALFNPNHVIFVTCLT